MVAMAIKLTPRSVTEKCGLCGREAAASADGPRLYLADRETAVCQGCGQKHAPSLAALVRLAQVARHVGRIGRHTVVPPMEALLALAQAAETYCTSVPAVARRAG
jgi:hypothetical protein